MKTYCRVTYFWEYKILRISLILYRTLKIFILKIVRSSTAYYSYMLILENF